MSMIDIAPNEKAYVDKGWGKGLYPFRKVEVYEKRLLMPHMVRKRLRKVGVGEDGLQCNHAVANLETTVRSLSSLILFRLKACCRQSSSLLHAWCSGKRCYKTTDVSMAESETNC